jgi:hypothetical protein
MEEVHPKEIRLESHLLIHLLDLLDGQHLTRTCLYHHGINHLLCNLPKPATKLPYKKLQYPTYVKNIDLNARIRVFKKAIKVNGETMEANIINMFGFTFKDNVYEWVENYI